jgi:hypothetical protein
MKYLLIGALFITSCKHNKLKKVTYEVWTDVPTRVMYVGSAGLDTITLQDDFKHEFMTDNNEYYLQVDKMYPNGSLLARATIDGVNVGEKTCNGVCTLIIED